MIHLASAPVVALCTVRVELLLVLAGLLPRIPALRDARLVAASVPVLRRRGQSLAAFLAEHRPDLVLYDLTSPYRGNWQFLQETVAKGDLDERRVVLLTSSAAALTAAAGDTGAAEIMDPASEQDRLSAVIERHCRPGAAELAAVGSGV